MRVSTRSIRLSGCLTACALLASGCADTSPPLDPGDVHSFGAAGVENVVYVGPPSGNPATDRASILAALEEVRPGGTVQFAPGTYVIGLPDVTFEYIEVTVPHTTLLAHPEGTTLRGCDPAEVVIVWGNCFGLELSGGHQAARNLTFEDFSQGLALGKDLFVGPAENRIGGYRVEGNTFRNTTFALDVFGQWPQPAIVRGNAFVNVTTAINVWGRTAHLLDNDFSAPEPGAIPGGMGAFSGVQILAASFLHAGSCDHNVVAGNRLDGYPLGLAVGVLSTGVTCKHNVVRDNTVVNSPEYVPGDPASPLAVYNPTSEPALVAHNLFQGNYVAGADGMGGYIIGGEHNRMVNNTILDVRRTELWPGWAGDGNGSGLWVSAGSHNNRILNTRFADIEAEEVVLEGDHNHVATRSASDVVRDLGTGNRVTGPGSVVTTAAPAATRTVEAAPAERGAGAARVRGERLGVRERLLDRGASREVVPR
jgi:hypothetical protein